MPKWWLHRHPVQYDEVDIEEQRYTAVCPHLDTGDAEHSKHIIWMGKQQSEDREQALMAYIIRNSTPNANLLPGAHRPLAELNEPYADHKV